MGKTTKPVTIIVTETEMLAWPVFVKMAKQGHQIVALDTLLSNLLGEHTVASFALVMGPRAHLLLPGMEAVVPVALKRARVEIYDKV